MKKQLLTIVLTTINLMLLVLLLTQSSRADSPTSVLQVRSLELVDANGQVRSRMNIEPSGDVVFRLMDQKGTIRVKIGANENGSGLVLLDETTAPGVQIIASQKGKQDQPLTTSLTLTSGDKQQTIKP
jgi:hypothetical protein